MIDHKKGNTPFTAVGLVRLLLCDAVFACTRKIDIREKFGRFPVVRVVKKTVRDRCPVRARHVKRVSVHDVVTFLQLLYVMRNLVRRENTFELVTKLLTTELSQFATLSTLVIVPTEHTMSKLHNFVEHLLEKGFLILLTDLLRLLVLLRFRFTLLLLRSQLEQTLRIFLKLDPFVILLRRLRS